MLESSPVSQCLDRRSKILGFELIDLFVIFFTMAILNLIFGHMDYRFILIWLPTLTLAIVLRITKTGKPDHYLKHLIYFYLTPKELSAFALSPVDSPLKILKKTQRRIL